MTPYYDDLDNLREGFTHVVFHRIHPEKNEARFYYLAWQPALFDGWAIVRIYGRCGAWHRLLPPLHFPSLEEAWPTIRAIIRRRLGHGYELLLG